MEVKAHKDFIIEIISPKEAVITKRENIQQEQFGDYVQCESYNNFKEVYEMIDKGVEKLKELEPHSIRVKEFTIVIKEDPGTAAWKLLTEKSNIPNHKETT